MPRSTSNLILLAALVLCLSSAAMAATSAACTSELQKTAAISNQADRTSGIHRFLQVNLRPACVAELILQSSAGRNNIATAIAGVAKDLQQTDSTTTSNASTNLVAKPLASSVLAIASDYGALTQTTNGQTTTISGSLDGIPLALEAHSHGLLSECPANFLDAACIPGKLLDALNRISYSVAVSSGTASQATGVAGASSGTAQMATLNGTPNTLQVTQVTGKLVIIQPKLTFANFTNALKKLDSSFAQAADAFSGAAQTLLDLQTNSKSYADWEEKTAQELSTKDKDNIVKAWLAKADDLVTVYRDNKDGMKSSDEIITAALNYFTKATAYEADTRKNAEAARDKPVLTFEYDLNTPVSQPANSVFRLIFSKKVGHNWSFTGNGAFSIYNSNPSQSIPGASRLRDAQIAAETDYDLPQLGILGKPTVSVAYYYQDQTSPAILNVTPGSPVPGVTFTNLSPAATQIFTQKGPINIGQAKIVFGSSKSGLSFPISFTASNRSELINKSSIQGQIGISYDFDSLLGGRK